jgi:polysaccharide chain length determinant protein (PEP-CTERM system associated)
MESVRTMLFQYLRAAWRRRWLGVVVAWLVCGVGWVGTYTIPNQFESNARLFVDADAILTPLLRGIAADSAPTTQLEILQRTLLSKPNLEKLISKTDLDLTLNGPSDRERLINRLATDIKVIPQTKNLFTISYRDKSPKLAHDVVQTLLTIFVESATGSNRTDMENARRFLERQIQSYEQQLRAAEKRRADFRVRYMEILPNDMNPNIGALEGARGKVVMTCPASCRTPSSSVTRYARRWRTHPRCWWRKVVCIPRADRARRQKPGCRTPKRLCATCC